MIRFLFRRLLLTIPVLVGVATLVFSLIHLVPGDPVQAMLGDSASPEDMAEMRTRLGLDRPLAVQYVAFVKGAATGDLGTSLRTNRAVISDITERLPATFELAGAAMTAAILIALPLGIVAAVWAGTRVDHAATTLALVGISMPTFWLGPLLAIVFSVSLGWFPVSGRGTPAHLVLPAITLSVVSIAGTMRYQRTAMLEALRFPYILTARAKGLTERQVLWHGWRNALFPVLTLFGLWLPILVSGSVFVESVFAWPGLGSLAAAAVGNRDYPLLMGAAILVAGMVVLAGFLTDIAYALLDPRVRFS